MNAEKHVSEPLKSTSEHTSLSFWVNPGLFILITDVLNFVRIYISVWLYLDSEPWILYKTAVLYILLIASQWDYVFK